MKSASSMRTFSDRRENISRERLTMCGSESMPTANLAPFSMALWRKNPVLQPISRTVLPFSDEHICSATANVSLCQNPLISRIFGLKIIG